MKFYVIYDFEVPHGESVVPFNPPFKSKEFRLTEIDQLNIFYADSDGYGSKPGKQRKYAGILTRKQFDALCDAQGLTAESTETMGSITDIGWLPAISFNSYSDCAYQNAYVTPLIEKAGGCNERDWERVKNAMLSVYS